MKLTANIHNVFDEKIAGFMERTPGIVAFIITLVIVAGILTKIA